MLTRDQFITAVSAAAGAFYDVIASGGRPASSGGGSGSGNAPKFDTSIARKGGMVQYASETDLEGLIFWKARAEEPPSDPKYEESNAKQAKALGYWIAYRQANPDAIWRGERNRVLITAKAPTNKPELYVRGEVQRDDAPTGGGADESYRDPPDEDDDIPF
jgi:hypothetical protein